MWSILLLALAGQVSGPEEVPVYQIAEHKVEGEWQSALWMVEGLEEGKHWMTSPDGLSIIWTAPPGKHRLSVFLVNWEQKKMASYNMEVNWIGKDPEPDPPGPNPPPPPPPPPNRKYQFAIILETGKLEELTPGQLEIVAGMEARKKINQSGHTLLAIGDIDTPPNERLRPYWNVARGKELPIVVRAPATGGVLEHIPLPDSVDELIGVLNTEYTSGSCPNGSCWSRSIR